jgi:hypothetical protein
MQEAKGNAEQRARSYDGPEEMLLMSSRLSRCAHLGPQCPWYKGTTNRHVQVRAVYYLPAKDMWARGKGKCNCIRNRWT